MGASELVLPTEIAVGGRTYEILSFVKGIDYTKASSMISHTKELGANLGEDDGLHILKYQNEIPGILRGTIAFVFTEWRDNSRPGYIAYIEWEKDCWVQCWEWLKEYCYYGNEYRVLRRKS